MPRSWSRSFAGFYLPQLAPHSPITYTPHLHLAPQNVISQPFQRQQCGATWLPEGGDPRHPEAQVVRRVQLGRWEPFSLVTWLSWPIQSSGIKPAKYISSMLYWIEQFMPTVGAGATTTGILTVNWSCFRIADAQLESPHRPHHPVPPRHLQLRRVPHGQRRHAPRRCHRLGWKVLEELSSDFHCEPPSARSSWRVVHWETDSVLEECRTTLKW